MSRAGGEAVPVIRELTRQLASQTEWVESLEVRLRALTAQVEELEREQEGT